MSDSSHSSRPKLSIGIFLESAPLSQTLLQRLNADRQVATTLTSTEEFFTFVEQAKQHLDCLVLYGSAALPDLAKWLHGRAVLLPAVIVRADPSLDAIASVEHESPQATAAAIAKADDPHAALTFTYHTAEVCITTDQLDGINDYIEQAIAQFLKLSPTCRLDTALSTVDLSTDLTAQNFLMLQQRRLADKLNERLGYLSVYYKRNARNFFRYMSPEQQEEVLEQLRSDYREIVLHYFEETETLNQRIDEFVNAAFFTDIATSQVVEIHMDLMDEFAKQLKLEGRSDDILLDYRLTLIDTIAHLCEMYRRSVPKET